MNKKLQYLLILILVLGLQQSFAQSKYKIYAGFVNHFTKFVQWPASAKSGDFIIAIVGNSPIATELQPLNGKTVGAQTIAIKVITSISAIQDAHIIFVAEGQTGAVADISKKAKDFNALVIAESPGAAQKGADINFVEIDGKIKFEINSSNADSHSIKISSELKKLGIAVE